MPAEGPGPQQFSSWLSNDEEPVEGELFLASEVYPPSLPGSGSDSDSEPVLRQVWVPPPYLLGPGHNFESKLFTATCLGSIRHGQSPTDLSQWSGGTGALGSLVNRHIGLTTHRLTLGRETNILVDMMSTSQSPMRIEMCTRTCASGKAYSRGP